MKQPEALRLADELERIYGYPETDHGYRETDQAAAELRRLHSEVERLTRIIDSRPAINAGLPESYIEWSRSIYAMEFHQAMVDDNAH